MSSKLASKRLSSEKARVLTKGALRDIDLGEFDVLANWEPTQGKIYTRTRAISARINQNFDGWPSEELKKSYRSFLGKPVFVNHVNDDPRKARGVVVASRYVENGDDKYIDVIQEVDADKFPRLAHELTTGGLDSVSMGCEAKISKCSYCGNVAESPRDLCQHVISHKGNYLPRVASNGIVEDVLVYEECRDIGFFELSYVFDPADETAVVSNVITARRKNSGETRVPPHVDTLRDEEEDVEEFFIDPPDQLKTPDLERNKEIGREKDGEDKMGNLKKRAYGNADDYEDFASFMNLDPQDPGTLTAYCESNSGVSQEEKEAIANEVGIRTSRSRRADVSRNDQGEQEETFISDTPSPESFENGDVDDDVPNESESDRVKTDQDRGSHDNLARRKRSLNNLRKRRSRRRASQSDDFDLDSSEDISRDVEDEDLFERPEETQPKDASRRRKSRRKRSAGYYEPESSYEIGDKVKWVMPNGDVEPEVGTVVDINNEDGIEFYKVEWDEGEWDETTAEGLVYYEGRKKSSSAKKVAFTPTDEDFEFWFDIQYPGTRLSDLTDEQYDQIYQEYTDAEGYADKANQYGANKKSKRRKTSSYGRGDYPTAQDAFEAWAADQGLTGDIPDGSHKSEFQDLYWEEWGDEVDRITAKRSSRRKVSKLKWSKEVSFNGTTHMADAGDFTCIISTPRGDDNDFEAAIQRRSDRTFYRFTEEKGTRPSSLKEAKDWCEQWLAGQGVTATRKRRAADESLDVAAPGGRVNVEAPTSGTTDDDAQDSQFDKEDFGNNAGDDLADPDLSTDQNWAPGEGKKESAFSRKATEIEGLRLAEAMIEAGLEPAGSRWKLAEDYTKLPSVTVRDRTRLLSRVANVKNASNGQNVRKASRASRGQVPQSLGQSPSLTKSASADRSDDYNLYF